MLFLRMSLLLFFIPFFLKFVPFTIFVGTRSALNGGHEEIVVAGVLRIACRAQSEWCSTYWYACMAHFVGTGSELQYSAMQGQGALLAWWQSGRQREGHGCGRISGENYGFNI
jgi:hypothetical protein